MYNGFFVCAMGIGTVFVGLICIIALTSIMSSVLGRKGQSAATPTPVAAPAAPTGAPVEDASLIAAVSAVIAEEMGVGVSAIRILSMKKI